MRKIRYVIFIMLIFILILSVSACKDAHDPPNTDPQNENVLTAEEAHNLFLSSQMPYDRSFQIEANSDKFIYYVNGDDRVFYIYEVRQNGTQENYIGKIDGQFYLVESFNDFFDESKNTSTFIKLNETEADIKLDDFFKQFDIFSQIKDNTIPLIECSKSYDSTLGDIIYSGTQHQTDGQVYSTDVNLYALVAERSDVSVFNFQVSYNELNLPAEIFGNVSIYQPYLPTSINFDYSIGTNDRLSYVFNYSDINLAMPNITTANDITPSEINLTPIDATFPDTFSTMLEVSSELQLPDPIENDVGFLGWYYDEEYKYPVEGQFQVGAKTIRVFAKWDTEPVTLELNGGKLAEDVFNYPTLKKYLNYEPYKIGYQFDGWYKDSAFENKLTWSDNTYIIEPTTLYAKWKKLVKINLSVDTDYKVLPLLGVTGQTIEYPNADHIVKKGGTFSSWYSKPDFTINAPNVFPENDTAVYAKFDSAICITIGDTAGQSYPNNYYNIPLIQSDTYNFSKLYCDMSESLNNQAEVLEDRLKVFSGWYTDSALSKEFIAYPTKDVTLYAKFSWAKYISFDLKGGSYYDENADYGEYIIQYYKNADYDGFEKLLARESSEIRPPEGKEFDKWYSDSGLTQAYEGTFWPDDDITLYAGYKEKT